MLFAFSAIKVAREYERGIVFRLGRLLPEPKGPGLFLLIPVVDRMVKVDLRTITLNIPPQEVITKDNVPVRVNAVAYFRIVAPKDAIVQIENFMVATSQIAQTTLRSVLGQHQLDELLSEREKINAILQGIIDEQTAPWGIKVSIVEVKDVEIPQSMQRAMARQAEAERERRAKVINAEGEYQASERLKDAAVVIEAHPIALQLRYLQTLLELGSSQSTTIAFPVPIEMLRPFVEAAASDRQALGGARHPARPDDRTLDGDRAGAGASGPGRPACRGHAGCLRVLRRPRRAHTARDASARRRSTGWDVRVVPNLYPALERQEVVIHGPAHTHSIGELADSTVDRIAEAWQRRARDVGGICFALINEGRVAGSSQPHSHSQLAWLPGPPPVVAAEHGLPDVIEVLTRDGVTAGCPAASRVPFEVLIAPVRSGAGRPDQQPARACAAAARRACAAAAGDPRGAARAAQRLAARRAAVAPRALPAHDQARRARAGRRGVHRPGRARSRRRESSVPRAGEG